MTHILIVTNRKGGTGKTSTAVNLAAEFAALGNRVLLIDLDTQGHCALGLGIPVKRGEPTVHDLFAQGHPLRPAIRASRWDNLHLLPANPLFEHGSGGQDVQLLGNAIKAEDLAGSYDIIILDTPPSHDALLLNALHAADRVLVPFLPHFLAGEGVRQLARVLYQVASQRTDKTLRVLGFVPVMSDNRIGLHRQTGAGIANQFGASRMLPAIRTDIRIAEAFAHGVPVRYFAAKSRGADDYRDLAQAVTARC